MGARTPILTTFSAAAEEPIQKAMENTASKNTAVSKQLAGNDLFNLLITDFIFLLLSYLGLVGNKGPPVLGSPALKLITPHLQETF
jgi:hypothetical protein